jgi:RHS repeat-associated protein
LRVTGADGSVSSQLAYAPYGVPAATPAGSAVSDPKFNGRPADEGTALMDFNARVYDPAIGRFLTSDDRTSGPLARQDSLNRYAFVWNAPATWSDPSGHTPVLTEIEFAMLVDVAVDELEADAVEESAKKTGEAVSRATTNVATSSDAATASATTAPRKSERLTGKARVNYGPTPRVKRDKVGGKFKRGSFRTTKRRSLYVDNRARNRGMLRCEWCNQPLRGVFDTDLDHVGTIWADRAGVMSTLENKYGEKYVRKDVLDAYNEDVIPSCQNCNRGHHNEPKGPAVTFGIWDFVGRKSVHFKPE